jgi:hypothetical protein
MKFTAFISVWIALSNFAKELTLIKPETITKNLYPNFLCKEINSA